MLPFIGLAALRANKLATGRPKDLADVAMLDELPTAEEPAPSQGARERKPALDPGCDGVGRVLDSVQHSDGRDDAANDDNYPADRLWWPPPERSASRGRVSHPRDTAFVELTAIRRVPPNESSFVPEQIICGYTVHPACAMLPMMSAASLAEMADDIRLNGQEQPIVMHRGLLLDGRNRLRACELAGVEPKIREWEGDDPVRWVLSLNFHRRHLTDSQKSIVGARAEDLLAERVNEPSAEGVESMPKQPQLATAEGEPESASDKPLSQREIRRQARESAAALVNVSPNAIARGRKLIDNAVPELVGAVARGTVSLSQAARVAKLDPTSQRDLVAKGDEAIVEEAVRIQKTKSAARPSVAKALAELDLLCAQLAIHKVKAGEWSVEGRMHDSEEIVSQRASTLKEALVNAWAQANAVAGVDV